jgi:hypothetical protein
VYTAPDAERGQRTIFNFLGPLLNPARPNAQLVGVARPELCEPLARVRMAGLADYEAVIELSYRAQLTAWWTLQPSVQRVFHPGGHVLADIPDAWAVIVQTTFRF